MPTRRGGAGGSLALDPNPALEPWGVLVGRWDTAATHPSVPGKTMRGQASFAWLEGGAFLLLRSTAEPPVPSSVAVFGTDDAQGACSMLYYDERGVSRRYDVAMADGVWKAWRDDPGFAQRFTGTFRDGGDAIDGVWELCEDGATWDRDLVVTYTRVR